MFLILSVNFFCSHIYLHHAKWKYFVGGELTASKISSSIVFSEHPFKNGFKQDDVLAKWCRHLHRNKRENGWKSSKVKRNSSQSIVLYLDNTAKAFNLEAGICLRYCWYIPLSPYSHRVSSCQLLHHFLGNWALLASRWSPSLSAYKSMAVK